MGKTIIEKLATCFQVSEQVVPDILSLLDIECWLGGDTLSVIEYAGCIDNVDTNKVYGHNGFWIADDENIAYVTNADPVWTAWDEETAQAIGLPWGSFSASMEKHRV